MPRNNQPKKPRLTSVRVEAEERDEIDWDRFAWALLQYARILSDSKPDKEQSAP